jgi:hypothetical protein
MTNLSVVALGDSVMWGQGLAPESKFATLAARRLADLYGRPFEAPRIFARSGSVHTPGLGDEIRPARQDFADTYPELVREANAVAAFLAGDETAAMALFGEIPASFPTIRGQIAIAKARLGAAVKSTDVVLLNGGANDLDFAATLQAQGTETADALAYRVQDALYARLLVTLRQTRLAFPNALIVVTGYFAPFTESSDVGKLEFFFAWVKHHLEAWNVVRPLTFLPGVDLIKSSVDKKIGAVVALCGGGYRQMLYWQRKAVTDANRDAALRGPGILFAHPRFDPKHGMYGPEPMFWGGYNPAADEVRDERWSRCPRHELEEALFTVAHFDAEAPPITIPPAPTPFPSSSMSHTAALDALKTAQGPRALVEALKSGNIGAIRAAAQEELGRLSESKTASVVHPNVKGAARYADAILDVVKRSRATSTLAHLMRHLRRLLPQANDFSDNEVLRCWGLDPALPAEILRDLMFPDVISVVVAGQSTGAVNLSLATATFEGVLTDKGGTWQRAVSQQKFETALANLFGTLVVGDSVPTGEVRYDLDVPHIPRKPTEGAPGPQTVDRRNGMDVIVRKHTQGVGGLDPDADAEDLAEVGVGVKMLPPDRALRIGDLRSPTLSIEKGVYRVDSVKIEINGHEIFSDSNMGKVLSGGEQLQLFYPAEPGRHVHWENGTLTREHIAPAT